MKNFKKNYKYFGILFILSINFISINCSIPFIGAKQESIAISIFDKKNYLNVDEYSFREYEWNRDSKAAEEIYIRGLSDFFFKEQYDKAAVLFKSSLKIYKKDARVYVRLAECYARINELNEAISILNTGANEILGFDALPGIVSYKRELNDKINESFQSSEIKKRNIFIRILTLPTKLWPF